MADAPETVPLDDRSWPSWAVPFSAASVVATLGIGVWLAVGAAGRGTTAGALTVAGWLAFGAVGFVLFGAAFRHRVAGRPIPGRIQLAEGVAVVVGLAAFYGFDRAVGGALLDGLIGGLMVANIVAIRGARANRSLVDTEEAARTDEAATAGPPGASAPVGQALREVVGIERQRWLAWLAAGVVTAATSVLLGLPAVVPVCAGALAASGLFWVTRRLWAAWLASRDFRRAATPPRRAYVVLLRDPAPQMMRPMLGIWSEPPVVRDGHLPRPEQVYRCDEERDALECGQGAVVVHEAWVDTGPRRRSRPRWVAADTGIVIPHRRALGRWYMSALVRGGRPGPPVPLTTGAPHPDHEVVADLGGARGSFAAVLGRRLAMTAAFGGFGLVVFLVQ